MKIKKRLTIDSAHRLTLPYESKCNNLHGHTWHIAVTVYGEEDDNGMLIDFSAIKAYFSKYDHVLLNDVVEGPTTAENLARTWAKGVKGLQPNIRGVKVEVAETEDNVASYCI